MTITNKQYTNWKRNYDKSGKTESVGKHFCGTFGVSDPVLFYADDKTAYRHIWKHYIKL